MKNKGISLIVLIITIVVIIILATAIIVNIAQTNMIGNAKEAVVKQDFKTMQDELNLYIADKYADALGNFKVEDIDVTDKAEIAEIIPSIVGTKYEEYVVIEDGKIAISETMPEPDKTWAMEALGLKKTSNNRPTGSQKTEITTTAISTYTEITVKINVETGKVEKYYFRLGESGDYIESDTNEYTFEELKVNTEYTIYTKVLDSKGKESDEYTETIVTKDIEGIVTITREPEIANGEYTAQDIKVTLSYEGSIPSGYELQYKTDEKDWTTYTQELTITSNTAVKARLYNKIQDDEKASNSISIACIDKEGPTIPTTLNLTSTTNSITAIASGSSDEKSYPVTYEYSINNNTWQTSGTLTELNSHTKYTVYARAKDKIGNVSEVKQNEIVTKLLASDEHNYEITEVLVSATSTTGGKVKKVCTICEDEITADTPKLGEIAKWNYTVDEENGKVELSRYNGTDTDVTIYGCYEINGKMYQTTIASNDYDEGKGFSIANYMFDGNKTVKKVTFAEGIDTSNLTGMGRMFAACTSLTSANLNNIDTSNVANMRATFNGCSSLENIDLSGLDTSNVTTMFNMFYNCTSLENANLSGLDTLNVKDMSSMFNNCKSLKSVNLSGMNTSSVQTMSFMFNHCEVLEKLDLSSFDTSNVTDMEQMFCSCSKLTELKLSEKFNTSKVTKMTRMFCYCSSLSELDLTSFDTRNTTLMDYLFEYCSNLKTIYATEGKWSTSQADTYKMFSSCGTSKVTYK